MKQPSPNVFLNVRETHLVINLLERYIKSPLRDRREKYPQKLVDKLYAIWER